MTAAPDHERREANGAKLDSIAAAISPANGAARPLPTEGAPPVRLIRGDAVTLEAVRWLWPGFLPASMLTILGGVARLRQNDHRAARSAPW